MIDAFSADAAGAVLVAQVQVGGVGLNIQAASVVVLCEPQLTPAAEDQAIARVHRMGQVRTVRVHRLLEPGGVDERIRALLAGKRRAFDEFVRESAVADGALARWTSRAATWPAGGGAGAGATRLRRRCGTSWRPTMRRRRRRARLPAAPERPAASPEPHGRRPENIQETSRNAS